MSSGCLRSTNHSMNEFSGAFPQSVTTGDPCGHSALRDGSSLHWGGYNSPATPSHAPGEPRALSSGCPSNPDHPVSDVSGASHQSVTTGDPCGHSALRDGHSLLQSYGAASNLMEFATSPDILHQPAVVQQLTVEGSTSPFHLSSLSSPPSLSSGGKPALLPRAASAVSSTPKQPCPVRQRHHVGQHDHLVACQ